MGISIVSSIIALIFFRICDNLFYVRRNDRKDRGRWFVGRSHEGNDDQIIYAYYPKRIEDGYRKYFQGIYTDDIEDADIGEDKWIL